MSKSIDRYVKLQGGFAIKSTDYRESGIPLIRISNVSASGLDKTNVIFVPKEYAYDLKDYLATENDTLIAMSGATTGKCCLVKKDDLPCIINQRVGRFVINDENKVDKKFVYYIISSHAFQYELLKDAVGGAQPNVSPKQIEKINWDFPLYNQQKKIAKILSTTDTVIEKTQAAIAKYKAIKQGMLHDLFTRGIDITTGKLRPKQEDAPELYKESELGWMPKEWDLDNFENASQLITDFTANGSFETLRLNVKYYYEPNYARLIRLTDLRVNLENDGVYVDREGFEFLSKSSLLENDIMLANVGEYTGFACLMPRVNYPATIAPNMFLIRCNLEIFDPLYMYYFMILDMFTRQVDNISASSATKLLNKTNFRKLHMIKPSVIEQKQIGSRLQGIDNKINVEQNYLPKLQQIKSGLMADLLSGKKLVTVTEELETQTN